MEKFSVKYNRTINYYETDKMGITHHSNYIRFMEEARINFLEKIDYSYSKLEQLGIISPVVSISCDFKLPTTFNDNIEIEVFLESYSGVQFEFRYIMTNLENGKVVFEGKSKHCFTNPKGYPIIIKRQYPELDSILKKYINN